MDTVAYSRHGRERFKQQQALVTHGYARLTAKIKGVETEKENQSLRALKHLAASCPKKQAKPVGKWSAPRPRKRKSGIGWYSEFIPIWGRGGKKQTSPTFATQYQLRKWIKDHPHGA